MINPKDLENEIVRPTLNHLSGFDEKLNSPEAIDLMMGTAAQESGMGYYLKQQGGGPARGIWQIETMTYLDIIRYLERPENVELCVLVSELMYVVRSISGYSQLVGNLPFSCAIARIKYWMIPEAIPSTLQGQAEYWNKYYNANDEHGTEEEYIKNYFRFVKEGIR